MPLDDEKKDDAAEQAPATGSEEIAASVEGESGSENAPCESADGKTHVAENETSDAPSENADENETSAEEDSVEPDGDDGASASLGSGESAEEASNAKSDAGEESADTDKRADARCSSGSGNAFGYGSATSKAARKKKSAASLKPARRRFLDTAPTKKERRSASDKLGDGKKKRVNGYRGDELIGGSSSAEPKRDGDASYKKPFLARFYDKLMPGDYTKKQDLRHSIAVFAFLLALVGVAFSAFWIWSSNNAYSVSSELVIPKAAYTSGQEQNVEDMLEGNGFKNIYADEDGNFHAFGTPDRVQNYKNDYYQRTVKTTSEDITRDYSDFGVVNVYVEPDWSKMTIDTIYDELDAATATYVFRNGTLDNLVRVYAVWRQINTGGDKMELVIRAADGTALIDEDVDSADAVVSRLQAEEQEASSDDSEIAEGASDASEGEDQSNAASSENVADDTE